MREFKLSAVLAGHTSDVRAVNLSDDDQAITASRDGTTRLWKRTSNSPPTFDMTELSHGVTFKTCLAYAPVKGYPEGLIFIGGQDTLIEARQPSRTAEHNADGLMIGHSNQVCSLDVNPWAGYLVSGSWDGTARVWELGKWESALELQGHGGSVWAVVAYDEDTIVTGCADQTIRVFDSRGKVKTSFPGKDVVRAITKLPKATKLQGHIAAATNDGIIRVWSLKGQMHYELVGHEAFIYSLATLESGELVSSGEDRTVRIWDGASCVQVITLPAISVWSVAVCPNGDIIAGSSDKMARIFTRDEGRLADPTTITQFEERVQSSTIPQQQVGEINKTDAPGPEFLQKKSGTKEGQIQMIKEDDGSIFAYQWSVSQGWVKVGQVVDSAGSSSSKKTYLGKEYDYVFDIDIEDGKPPLRLPFNVTQNPHEVAMKFLQDNELPMSYLEETANFIVKNSQGASLGQTAQPEVPGPDPYGIESRYRPGDAAFTSSYIPPPPSAARKLPHKEYIPILAGTIRAPQNQIMKLISHSNPKPDPHYELSSDETVAIARIFAILDDYQFEGPAFLASSKEIMDGISVLVKIATTWEPVQNRLAGLDLLRFLAAAVKDFPDIDNAGNKIVTAVAQSGIFGAEIFGSNLKLAMVAVRFFSNLMFGSVSGRKLIESKYELVDEAVKVTVPKTGHDVPLAVAVTTYYLNMAVYCTSEHQRQRHETVDRALSIVGELSNVLSKLPSADSNLTGNALQQATEPAYRGIVAMGTILVGVQNEDVILAAKEIFSVDKLMKQLQQKKLVGEPRSKPFVAEIEAALS